MDSGSTGPKFTAICAELTLFPYERKDTDHPITSTGCSTICASLVVSQEDRTRDLWPVAMESATLARTKPCCLVQF
jgi:hypothetical protein